MASHERSANESGRCTHDTPLSDDLFEDLDAFDNVGGRATLEPELTASVTNEQISTLANLHEERSVSRPVFEPVELLGVEDWDDLYDLNESSTPPSSIEEDLVGNDLVTHSAGDVSSERQLVDLLMETSINGVNREWLNTFLGRNDLWCYDVMQPHVSINQNEVLTCTICMERMTTDFPETANAVNDPNASSDSSNSTNSTDNENLRESNDPNTTKDANGKSFIPERAVTLKKCSHSFGQICLLKWLSQSKTCPLCRASLTEEAPLMPSSLAWVGSGFLDDQYDPQPGVEQMGSPDEFHVGLVSIDRMYYH